MTTSGMKFAVAGPPRGFSVFGDIQVCLPELRIETIVDVGSNIGQSAERYASLFPGSRIFCLEPVAESFRQLEQNTQRFPQVRLFQCALGASQGTVRMVAQGTSTMNRVMSREEATEGSSFAEEVRMQTLDGFCESQRIGRVSYLKVDTEGGDLDVLRGGEELLRSHAIDFVEVEAGMNLGNTRHCSFESLKAFLEERAYYLFGIYEQVHEWPTRKPHLRRTNPVFMSQRVIDEAR